MIFLFFSTSDKIHQTLIFANYLSLFVFYELSVIKNIVSDIYTEIIILYIVQKKFYKIAGLEKGEYDNFIFLIFLNNKDHRLFSFPGWRHFL
jgi:hypothetical protein